jgi:UDP-N-acetylmuramate dehydrogenase
MNIEKLIESIPDIVFEKNKNLSKNSTMKLESYGDLLTVKSKDSLSKLLKIFSENKIEFITLGLGANQVLGKKSNLPYIKLNLPFDKKLLESINDKYNLPASIPLTLLTQHAIKYELDGWEKFTGIPATLGGAIFMNAGTSLGEIGSLVETVTIINKSGEEKKIEVNKDSFSYRKNNFMESGDIIVEAQLLHSGKKKGLSKKIKDYLELRSKSQPLWSQTCGCIFKNLSETCRAGHYIDILGLKGLRFEDVGVSCVHGNFMINHGNSNSDQVLKLIEIINAEMELNFSVKFEVEAILPTEKK